MKILHKRHKASNIFPMTLRWVKQHVHVLASGNIFTRSLSDSCIVHKEMDLWETKHSIESSDNFLYWETDWDEIEQKLDDDC